MNELQLSCLGYFLAKWDCHIELLPSCLAGSPCLTAGIVLLQYSQTAFGQVSGASKFLKFIQAVNQPRI